MILGFMYKLMNYIYIQVFDLKFYANADTYSSLFTLCIIHLP